MELIAGKLLLPWFGGASAVWATSLVFFQLLLLAGYAYAHYAPRLLGDRRHAAVHAGLVLASAAGLLAMGSVWASPITPDDSWRPDPTSDPVLGVFGLLAVTVGAPFLLLSTSGPLLQRWYAHLAPGAGVYRLYAVSNAGSLLGLLAYPLLVEPWLRMRAQGWAWALLYAGFAVAVAATAAARLRGGETAAEGLPAVVVEVRAPGGRWPWLVLPMLSSMLLLATTNVMCAEVAVVPMLWILPLSVYLLSWILAFESGRFYARHVVFGLLLAALPALFLLPAFPIRGQLLLLVAAQGIASMGLHGELRRARPPTSELTLYYLLISAGSAVGGLFVALAAPLAFPQYWELPLALVLTAAFFVHRQWGDAESWLWEAPSALLFALTTFVIGLMAALSESIDVQIPGGSALFWGSTLFVGALTVVRLREGDPAPRWAMPGWVAGWSAMLLVSELGGTAGTLSSVRNFYGIVRVRELGAGTDEAALAMEHGRTLHGVQLRAEGRERTPTTYFGPHTGLGLLLGSPGGPRRIGVVGLGVGTVAAWARPGDTLTFYEINPAVIDAAAGPDAVFTFTREAEAAVEVVLGDGRLSLEQELREGRGRDLDVLVLDAFSGDAIPVHLLTVEAFEVYLARLAPDGVLALQATNRNVDLERPVAELVRAFGLHAVRVDNPAGPGREAAATWVLASRDPAKLDAPGIAEVSRPLSTEALSGPWTDDYSNLLQILR